MLSERLKRAITRDPQLAQLAQRLAELMSTAKVDPAMMERLAAEGDLAGISQMLGTSESELRFLFRRIHQKAERLERRFPELREPPG